MAMRRQVSASATGPVGMFAFWVMAAIVLLNISGMSMLLFKVERLMSGLLLTSCLLIFVTHRFAFVSTLGRTGMHFLVFMVTFVGIGTLMGLDRPDRLYNSMLHYSATLVFVVASAFIGRQAALHNYLPRIIAVVFWLGVASCLTFYLVAMFPSLRVFLKDSNRYSGVFADPNEGGSHACIVMAAGFALLTSTQKRLWVICGILVAAGAAIITFSRGATITCLLLVFSQVLFSPVFKRKSMFIALSLLMAMLGYVFLAGASSFSFLTREQRERLQDITMLLTSASIDVETRSSGRDVVASEALDIWRQSPVLGAGLGALMRMPKTNLGAHNTYLVVLGESGVIASFFLAVFLLSLVLGGWRAPPGVMRTFVLGYSVVLLLSLFTSHKLLIDRNHNLMLGLAIGMLSAMRTMKRAAPTRLPSRRPPRPMVVVSPASGAAISAVAPARDKTESLPPPSPPS